MISWVYGLRRLLSDIKFMMNISLGIYWKFCLGFFVPISLIAIFIYFVLTYGASDVPGRPNMTVLSY